MLLTLVAVAAWLVKQASGEASYAALAAGLRQIDEFQQVRAVSRLVATVWCARRQSRVASA